LVEEKKDISTGNFLEIFQVLKPGSVDILQVVSRANPHFS